MQYMWIAGLVVAGGLAQQATAEPVSAQLAALPVTALSEVLVTGRREIFTKPTGQTITAVTREQYENSTAFTVGELLTLVPGVTVAQGNGPRDVSISVRGSNARQTFGVRNVQVFEDGFSMTQPDGLARTDLVDPHAYAGIDVAQGPASALYGNYATGGAIFFRSRTGADIAGANTRGLEVGTDIGRFGYRNHYVSAGAKTAEWDYALFASQVEGDGFTNHTDYDTNTINLLATYTPSSADSFTFKLVNNNMDTDVSVRLSLNQYRKNPYQHGCADIAVAGCAAVGVLPNGRNGTRVNYSADALDIGRHDRRTIAATRWEHTFAAGAVWRTQLVYDFRDISQPTNSSSSVGTYPSFNLISDMTLDGEVAGFSATHFFGVFANYEDIDSETYNVVPGDGHGSADLGAVTQRVAGSHANYGARAREEIRFNSEWSGVAGIGIERTNLDATATSFSYPTAGGTTAVRVNGERDFTNIAPELSVLFQPDDTLRLRARLAAGYGTPQAGNLFITPAGVAGNNTQLDPQRNTGLDIGAEWLPAANLQLSVTAFYERFTDELVSQSPGAGLQTYTFNAPRSIHRGVEAGLNWQPLPEWLPGAKIAASYLRNDQYYDDYEERLSAGNQSAAFDRSGNKIPGVAPQYLHVRVGYDHKSGALNGLGGFIESDYREAAYVDNANLVKMPGYTLYNLNLHYDTAIEGSLIAGLQVFVEVRNLFDKTYVASASNVSNSISATTGLQNSATSIEAATGLIWAGQPRTWTTGVRLKF